MHVGDPLADETEMGPLVSVAHCQRVRDYIDSGLFEASGIRLSFFDYSGYPEYPQRFGGFEHGVTVLDLLFNAGPQAPRFMKSFASTR